MKSQQKCVVVFALGCCCALLMALIFSAVDVWGDEEDGVTEESCSRSCRVVLVENIPEDLSIPYKDSVSMAAGLGQLLDEAQRSVEIVSPQWALNASSQSDLPQARAGQMLLAQLMGLRSRSISLKVVTGLTSSSELRVLSQNGADVHYLDMKPLIKGHLNSSFWIVDRKHLYIGSAGMDWRSLSTVKELGLVLYDCSCLALDLQRIFNLYRQLQYKEFVPSLWSKKLNALFSRDKRLSLQLNSTPADAFISSSPDVFCPKHRTKDIDAIKKVIHEAETFIYISIPDYLPMLNRSKLRYWSHIDNMLREALILKRNLQVRLLISCQDQTNTLTLNFLWSLKTLCLQTLNCSVEAKLLFPRHYRCVSGFSHTGFMVTDTSLYVGSLNWVGNEFVSGAGVGLVISEPMENNTSVVERLRAVFDRDWHSPHSKPLQPPHIPACSVQPLKHKE